MPLRHETTRLILRAFEDRDSEPFSPYRSYPEVAKYQGWETPFTIEQATRFLKEMESKSSVGPGEWYQVAIELRTTGEMAGDCAFQRPA